TRQIRFTRWDDILPGQLVPQFARSRAGLCLEFAAECRYTLMVDKQRRSSVSLQGVKMHQRLIAGLAKWIQRQQAFGILNGRREFARLLEQRYEISQNIGIFLP